MSVPRLIKAAKALPDPHLACWLKMAVASLRGGKSADQALSLAGPAAIAERNRQLRAAARTLAPDLSDWQAANELRTWILYIQSRPDLLADYPDVPETLQHLVDAMLTADTPTSQRRIYDCLVTDA